MPVPGFDLLTEVLRQGAQRMLAEAIRAEVDHDIAARGHLKDAARGHLKDAARGHLKDAARGHLKDAARGRPVACECRGRVGF